MPAIRIGQPTGHNDEKTSFQARGYLLDREADSPARDFRTKTRPRLGGNSAAVGSRCTVTGGRHTQVRVSAGAGRPLL
jgi:hypothetical protein